MMGKNRKRRHDGEPEMELMYQENFVVVDIPGKGLLLTLLISYYCYLS